MTQIQVQEEYLTGGTCRSRGGRQGHEEEESSGSAWHKEQVTTADEVNALSQDSPKATVAFWQTPRSPQTKRKGQKKKKKAKKTLTIPEIQKPSSKGVLKAGAEEIKEVAAYWQTPRSPQTEIAAYWQTPRSPSVDVPHSEGTADPEVYDSFAPTEESKGRIQSGAVEYYRLGSSDGEDNKEQPYPSVLGCVGPGADVSDSGSSAYEGTEGGPDVPEDDEGGLAMSEASRVASALIVKLGMENITADELAELTALSKSRQMSLRS
jgi:hypothetical protein